MEMEFDQWFDILTDYCRNTLNYDGSIDRETFEMEFEMDNTISPEQSAREFVKEMNCDG